MATACLISDKASSPLGTRRGREGGCGRVWGGGRGGAEGVRCLRASAVKVHFFFFFLQQLVPNYGQSQPICGLDYQSLGGAFGPPFFCTILYVCLHSREGKGGFSKVGQKERCPAAGVIQTLSCESSASVSSVSKGAKVLSLKNLPPFLGGIIRGVAGIQHMSLASSEYFPHG